MIVPIHPFPARMAPEVALDGCASLRPGSTVLDPMTGSGTVLRAAARAGLHGIGFDLDPLAVLMAKVWTTPIELGAFRAAGELLVEGASKLDAEQVALPWIDEDSETRSFIDYWFARRQQADLRRLAFVLSGQDGAVADTLRVALSRIIITKDRGASLGRDVSHSRPHKVMTDSDFSVFEAFRRSVSRVADRLGADPPPGNVHVAVGDARAMNEICDGTVDALITSPPYLNALDYLRGHRLSLVWLGYRVGDLRRVRAASIGAERSPDSTSCAEDVVGELAAIVDLPPRIRRMVERYGGDLIAVMNETRRVLKPGGTATFVVGNSCLRGVFVDNAALVMKAAIGAGLEPIRRHDRELPPNRRYLPPPVDVTPSELKKRMRTEAVLTFAG